MSLIPIGIAGVARSGKDTLFRLLKEELEKKGVKVAKVSLADPLKSELDDFLVSKLGISAFTTDNEDKTLIRPILVEYARIKRVQTKGRYFTDLATPKIKSLLQEGFLPVITDIRYAEYKGDELDWLTQELKGKLIHLSRLDTHSKLIEPANVDERLNNPRLILSADQSLIWHTPLNSLNLDPELKEWYLSKIANVVTKWIT